MKGRGLAAVVVLLGLLVGNGAPGQPSPFTNPHLAASSWPIYHANVYATTSPASWGRAT